MTDERGVPTPAQRARVLVVDDDPTVAKAIRRLLGSQHEVTIADAPDALARIEGGERFDVVLCDLMMPVVSGMEVYRRIRARAPSLADHVVFVTGGIFTADAERFLHETGAACLEKPFQREELRRTVADALEGTRGRLPPGS